MSTTALDHRRAPAHAIMAALEAAIPQMLSARPNAGSVGGPSASPVNWRPYRLGGCRIGAGGVRPGLAEAGDSDDHQRVDLVQLLRPPALQRAGAEVHQHLRLPPTFGRSPLLRGERLRPIVRLFREISFHHSGTPSLAFVATHAVSGHRCSILMTSAP